MSYGKLITRFTSGRHDIFITCPAKSMHREPGRSAGNYYIKKGVWLIKVCIVHVNQKFCAMHCC